MITTYVDKNQSERETFLSLIRDKVAKMNSNSIADNCMKPIHHANDFVLKLL